MFLWSEFVDDMPVVVCVSVWSCPARIELLDQEDIACATGLRASLIRDDDLAPQLEGRIKVYPASEGIGGEIVFVYTALCKAFGAGK